MDCHLNKDKWEEGIRHIAFGIAGGQCQQAGHFKGLDVKYWRSAFGATRMAYARWNYKTLRIYQMKTNTPLPAILLNNLYQYWKPCKKICRFTEHC